MTMYTPYGIVVVSLIAAGLVVINVLLHYEVLSLLSTLLAGSVDRMMSFD